MQRPPAEAAAEAEGPDYYRILKAALHVTKAELEASVRSMRKTQLSTPLSPADAERFAEACSVLLDVKCRKECDASRGYGSPRFSDFRLIRCFS